MAFRNADLVQADAQYYAANRERIKARQRAYNAAHPDVARAYRLKNRERLSAQRLAWRKKHPERDAAAQRKYQASGKSKRDRTAYRRAYYERNRDKVLAQSRAWAKTNVEKARAKRARRRARLAGAVTVPFTADQLQARRSMFGGRCWICRAPATEDDHVKPLARGGAHILANLRPACRPCNRRKGAR